MKSFSKIALAAAFTFGATLVLAPVSAEAKGNGNWSHNSHYSHDYCNHCSSNYCYYPPCEPVCETPVYEDAPVCEEVSVSEVPVYTYEPVTYYEPTYYHHHYSHYQHSSKNFSKKK